MGQSLGLQQRDNEEKQKSSSECEERVVQKNKKALETHHGSILQRFDSADWSMYKKKQVSAIPVTKGQTDSNSQNSREKERVPKLSPAKTDMQREPRRMSGLSVASTSSPNSDTK